MVKPIINPQVITILMGGIPTIPSHDRFMAARVAHYWSLRPTGGWDEYANSQKINHPQLHQKWGVGSGNMLKSSPKKVLIIGFTTLLQSIIATVMSYFYCHHHPTCSCSMRDKSDVYRYTCQDPLFFFKCFCVQPACKSKFESSGTWISITVNISHDASGPQFQIRPNSWS